MSQGPVPFLYCDLYKRASVVQFPKFLDISEIRHGEVKFEVEFYTGSSLMAVSAHAH